MNVNISEVPAWIGLLVMVGLWVSGVAIKFNDIGQLKKALIDMAKEHKQAVALLEAEQKNIKALYEERLDRQEAVFNARQISFESKVESIHASEKTAVNNKLDFIISELGNLKVGLAEVKTTVNERTGRTA